VIPDPALACTNEDEERHYRRQLELFSSCSTEKGIELVKIGMVIRTLRKREAFLDIGAGGGHLTVPISQHFQKTVVIEPNAVQAEILRRRCPDLEVICDTWDGADLFGREFDLILCSHVLYYIPSGTWPATIGRMHDRLAPGGCLVIVLQSPLGEVADFFRAFTDYDVPILELTRDLIDRYGEDAVTLEYFQNEIFSESLEDMVEIGLFLLADSSFSSRTGEIRDFFREKRAVPGGFRIRQDEILLVVRRDD